MGGFGRGGGVPKWDERGYPPMFCKEWGSGVESAGCGRAENKSVQAVEKKGVADLREWAEVVRVSKREVEFTNEYNMWRSRCQ
jgi:hypothetical protein